MIGRYGDLAGIHCLISWTGTRLWEAPDHGRGLRWDSLNDQELKFLGQGKTTSSCWVDSSSVGWSPMGVVMNPTEEEPGWGLAEVARRPWD